MDFSILGPLEVRERDGSFSPGAAKQRALLAVLLLHANEVVSGDRLIDDLWGSRPPDTAANALQVYVGQLRKALEPGRPKGTAPRVLITRPGGYLLRVDPGRLDSQRFEQLLGEGLEARAAGDEAAGARLLRGALELWRGDALADFTYEPFAQAEIARLEELRQVALEERIDAELALGEHRALVGELEALVRDHALRERFRGQLMLALYRSGRQADALDAYRDAHRTLVEELGITPGPGLQELEESILRQEADLEPSVAVPARGVGGESPTRLDEIRKTVTVLVLGRSGAEGVDPEALRSLDERYLQAVEDSIERHGGSVQTVLGDEVMAVFGVPLVHEDDALRAARAAIELREGGGDPLPGNGADGRVEIGAGIATGEVVSGAGNGQPTVVGTPLALAGRLAVAAATGEILLADSTRQLLGDAARVEPTEAGDHPGWRLLDLVAAKPPLLKPPEAPMVGRDRELAQLRRALDDAAAGRCTRLVTVLGPAGIGKSRLVEEFASEAAADATMLAGRCVPYGEGITFWALGEIVRQLAPSGSNAELLPLVGGDEQVAERVREAVGLSQSTSTREQLFAAFRTLFESVAVERPLVLVIEDIHWAEPTFLDLIEYLAAPGREAPVLIVCLAREELLEGRADWSRGGENAGQVLLHGLDDRECDSVIAGLGVVVSGATRARLREAAEGNPLFLRHMVAMVRSGEGLEEELPIPPTIQAVLASRLDRLGPGERTVIERAAVIGKVFTTRAVVELLPGEARQFAGRHLDALAGKDMLREDSSASTDDRAFRFGHVLIQQAAYREIPKWERAALHESLADWLQEGEEAVDRTEVIGYHFEQAYRYRAELKPVDDEARSLARRGAERLGDAGRAAYSLGDMPAAVNLLGRAVSLLPSPDPVRLELLPDLGSALFEVGQVDRASTVLAEAVEEARTSGDQAIEWRAIVKRDNVRLCLDPQSAEPARLNEEARRSVDALEALGEESSLGMAWNLICDSHWMMGQARQSLHAAERAGEHARRAGNRRDEVRAVGEGICLPLLHGETPVQEGVRRIEAELEQSEENPLLEASLPAYLAVLEAMAGRSEDARRRIARSRRLTGELGLTLESGVQAALSGRIELLAGDPVASERDLLKAAAIMTEIDDTWWLSTVKVDLARSVYAQGHEEAFAEVVAAIDEVPAPADQEWHIKRGTARGLLSATQGHFEQAEDQAREAVAIAGRTDLLSFHADAVLDLAEVLRLAGQEEAAAAEAGKALALYERKGDVVSAERARAKLTVVTGS
jgi:DNA-binding SARP family transcriptional activator/tetratricopeptide (TPR) repeat protein